jgi:hypothetical protein
MTRFARSKHCRRLFSGPYKYFDWIELAYLAGVVVLSFLAGLVPAMKAYRTPVATSLVAA